MDNRIVTPTFFGHATCFIPTHKVRWYKWKGVISYSEKSASTQSDGDAGPAPASGVSRAG